MEELKLNVCSKILNKQAKKNINQLIKSMLKIICLHKHALPFLER